MHAVTICKKGQEASGEYQKRVCRRVSRDRKQRHLLVFPYAWKWLGLEKGAQAFVLHAPGLPSFLNGVKRIMASMDLDGLEAHLSADRSRMHGSTEAMLCCNRDCRCRSTASSASWRAWTFICQQKGSRMHGSAKVTLYCNRGCRCRSTASSASWRAWTGEMPQTLSALALWALTR